jgi:hypothetical protein
MKQGFLAIALICAASSSLAQHAHQSMSPSETGQSQFAAIAEIAALLQGDPKTDWTQVDIKALRDHLVDMDNVTTQASVARSIDELIVTFTVTGDEITAQSIQRMVLAHSPMLQQSTGWIVKAKEQSNGATMEVQVTSQVALNQVLGLGFFGLMTIGAHHQQHHLMIASGRSPH